MVRSQTIEDWLPTVFLLEVRYIIGFCGCYQFCIRRVWQAVPGLYQYVRWPLDYFCYGDLLLFFFPFFIGVLLFLSGWMKWCSRSPALNPTPSVFSFSTESTDLKELACISWWCLRSISWWSQISSSRSSHLVVGLWNRRSLLVIPISVILGLTCSSLLMTYLTGSLRQIPSSKPSPRPNSWLVIAVSWDDKLAGISNKAAMRSCVFGRILHTAGPSWGHESRVRLFTASRGFVFHLIDQFAWRRLRTLAASSYQWRTKTFIGHSATGLVLNISTTVVWLILLCRFLSLMSSYTLQVSKRIEHSNTRLLRLLLVFCPPIAHFTANQEADSLS